MTIYGKNVPLITDEQKEFILNNQKMRIKDVAKHLKVSNTYVTCWLRLLGIQKNKKRTYTKSDLVFCDKKGNFQHDRNLVTI
jgi:hypothetical protein